jgi:ABC-2 type transport system ATP-binding protein
MLYPMLTGLENMTFFAEAVEKAANLERIELSLRSVSLWDDREVQVKSYSKGMLQRLGLAITLYQDSSILILDEPTSGIDPMGRKEILEVLKSLHDKTILLSSHHLDEIRHVCTHVAYLDNGKMEKFTVDEFLETHHLGGMES